MGAAPQPQLIRPPEPSDRRGIALLTALLVLGFLGVLSVTVISMADLGFKSERNRESSGRAVQVAEAGMAHALSVGRTSLGAFTITRLLRGSDNSANTADDGRLLGYSLASADEIPAAGVSFGGGTYFVQLLDDPADPNNDPLLDGNNQAMLRCWSAMPDGSSAEVRALIRNVQLPSVVVDGDLEISGKLAASGGCGGIHTNGNMTGGGEPTVTTLASATGTVSVNINPKQNGAAPIPVPDLDPTTLCAGATMIGTGTAPNYTNFTWKPTSPNLAANTTYCVRGNVEFDADFGDAATMRKVTVIAFGSMKNSKKTFMKSNHPDGIVLLAGGDMDIQGDARFEGLVYGRAQCYISAKPEIIGGLICKNKPWTHAGDDYVPSNLISGDAKVINNCNGMFNQTWRVAAWFPSLGS